MALLDSGEVGGLVLVTIASARLGYAAAMHRESPLFPDRTHAKLVFVGISGVMLGLGLLLSEWWWIGVGLVVSYIPLVIFIRISYRGDFPEIRRRGNLHYQQDRDERNAQWNEERRRRYPEDRRPGDDEPE